jgi:hypothetical protein
MILSGSLVQMKGRGLALVSAMKSWIATPGPWCACVWHSYRGCADIGIINDDVDRQFCGRFGIDDVKEADELLMALHALADDFAFNCVEGGKQGRGAVPFVIVRHCSGAPLLHRHARLGAVERLDLALLIDRQNDGVVGRIDIEPDNVAQFGGELRILAQFELTHAIRVLSCIPQTRMAESARESMKESRCQIYSTSMFMASCLNGPTHNTNVRPNKDQ